MWALSTKHIVTNTKSGTLGLKVTVRYNRDSQVHTPLSKRDTVRVPDPNGKVSANPTRKTSKVEHVKTSNGKGKSSKATRKGV